MELSLFLAKLFGFYLLIISAIWLLYKKQFESAIKDMFFSSGLLAFSGFFNLFFGLAIVIAHPIFEANWRGLITLFGYLALVKGVVRVAFQSYCQKMLAKMLKKETLIVIIMVVVGAILLYHGFMGS